MKFSVITVCYNAVDTIEETILSIVNQDFKDTEYIIIDGGSTDGTIEITDKYKGKISCIISEPDNGIYDAMKKGLKHAHGDFVIFIGADDHFISFNTLSRVADYISRNNDLHTIYYGDVFRPIRNDIYCHKFNRYKLAVKNISHQAIFYPKCIYSLHNYNTEYKVFADYVYNLTLYGKVTFKYIGLTVSYFNDSGISSTVTDTNFDKVEKKLKIKHLGLIAYIYSVIYHLFRNLIKG